MDLAYFPREKIINDKPCFIMVTNINGILAALDWNSHQWQQAPSEKDLEQSFFPVEAAHKLSYAALNFGHEQLPADEETGYYSGLLPQLEIKPPDRHKVRHVKIAFLKSKNWSDGQTYLVGFYAFPVFEKGLKTVTLSDQELELDFNIKALPKDIHLLEQPVNLTINKHLKGYVPKGKDLAKQAINFLNREHVLKVLDEASAQNPGDAKLKSIKFRIMKTLGFGFSA